MQEQKTLNKILFLCMFKALGAAEGPAFKFAFIVFESCIFPVHCSTDVISVPDGKLYWKTE